MKPFIQGVFSGGGGFTPPEIVNYDFGIGQSNKAGRMYSSDLVGELAYLAPPIEVGGNKGYIINKALGINEFQQMEAGVNTSDNAGQMGDQPKLAYNMVDYTGKDFYYIQVAYGGTPIENYIKGSANFDYVIDKARELRYTASQNNQVARFRSITFIQGESNGGDNSGIYEGKLRQMIADYRTFLQSPDLVFIIVQMIDCQTGVVNLAQLQQAQFNVSQDSVNNYLIAKESAPQTCRDPLHFSNEKYLDVSDKVFEIIKDL